MSALSKSLIAMVVVLALAVGALGFAVWPRDDVPQEPDAIVVLGGAGPERAELGIELAERYDAELLLSSSAAIFGEWQGRQCNVDAICFEPEPKNTAGEAENVARLAREQGWDHVTVATSDFHTARSRYLFRQCMGSDRVTAVGAEGDRTLALRLSLAMREATGLLAGATFARAC